jgi:hypothetical protein
VAEKQQRFALLSRFDKHYKFKLGQNPTYNKWVEQSKADALIESYGIEKCYELVEYYFEVAESPDWKHFVYFANAILEAKERQEKDLRERQQRRLKAKEWLGE